MDRFTFKRFEIKYRMTVEQMEELKEIMHPYMSTNEFSFSTIRNIYYDTEDYRLIRTSLEKPFYKEKLRIRSYKDVGPEDKIFVEIKKKYDHVVYKRRLSLGEADAMDWLGGDDSKRPDSQIGDEIAYFCSYYKTLRPAMYLSYDREAYEGVEDPDFRITFDTNILARTERLSLREAPEGERVIEPGSVIMEMKVAGAYPMWITRFLSEEKIYQTSFSKYGTAYQNMICSPADRPITQSRETERSVWILGSHFHKGAFVSA